VSATIQVIVAILIAFAFAWLTSGWLIRRRMRRN